MTTPQVVARWFQVPILRVPLGAWIIAAIALAVIIPVSVMFAGGSSPSAPQQPGALAAAPAPPVAPAVQPSAAIQNPIASQPTVPSGVLKFQNGLELYEAAMAGNVPVGTIVQVRGVLDPWHGDASSNGIAPNWLGIFYIPDPKEYQGSLRIAHELGGVALPCIPPVDSPHKVAGLKSGDKATVRGSLEKVRPRDHYAAGVTLINCTIISR